jgi:hypothetical protein
MSAYTDEYGPWSPAMVAKDIEIGMKQGIEKCFVGGDTSKPHPIPKDYIPFIIKASQAYALPPALLMGLIRCESGYDPNAVSKSDAHGLTQCLRTTYAEQGAHKRDIKDPEANILAGSRVLRTSINNRKGNLLLVLSDYNGGPGSTNNALKNGYPYHWHKETRNYVWKVTTAYNIYLGLTRSIAFGDISSVLSVKLKAMAREVAAIKKRLEAEEAKEKGVLD